MKIGGGCASIARTCIGEVWVRSRTLGVAMDVEGVLQHPRRVAGRVVERGEVVVVVLDLRALDTR